MSPCLFAKLNAFPHRLQNPGRWQLLAPKNLVAGFIFFFRLYLRKRKRELKELFFES